MCSVLIPTHWAFLKKTALGYNGSEIRTQYLSADDIATRVIVTLIELIKRKEYVVALQVPIQCHIQSLKTRSGREPLPGCEPITYQLYFKPLHHQGSSCIY